jgi:hypothetical protein
MAATAILDLVSVDYLTNACRLVRFFGASLGVINLHHVPLLPKPYLPYTHRQRPNRGHMPRLALPLLRFSVGTPGNTYSADPQRLKFQDAGNDDISILNGS